MPERSIELYLFDIFESAEAIQEYVKGYDILSFCNDRKTHSAVIREFEIIGEAVGKLPKNFKGQYADVPWQDIKDFRNLLIHEYFGIDLELVWQVIFDELPVLLKTIRNILQK